jgi:hypothetical protein
MKKTIGTAIFALLVVAMAIGAPKAAKAPERAAATQTSPIQAPTAAGDIGKTARESKKPGPTPPPARKQAPEIAAAIAPDFANQAEAKAYLAGLLGGTGKDYQTLNAIIECESGWNQYRPDGQEKISDGNVGLGQINEPTWQTFMQKHYNLDIYDEKQNLQATVIIYRRDGVAPWEPYSGKCWLPVLNAEGIKP